MVSSELLKEAGFKEEVAEDFRDHFVKTGYPKPTKRMRIVYEVPDLNIEEPYFWMLKYYRYDAGFSKIEKTEDTYASAETSAFFGITQQRLGGQQDKVSQFLATIGKMVKELFQLVRELRIIDERLTYYSEAAAQKEKPMDHRMKGAEITLKGMFIDLVQGGAKNAASVYGMARELEFTTLPDLFFDAPPFANPQEMENYVNKLDFNLKVKEVLKRHLRHFIEWKKRTHSEMVNRRRFTLQYLRQHFDIIKMYMEWAKPYLRNIERMSPKEKHASAPDLVAAFEGSMVDIEMMVSKPYGDFNSVILATFNYRTSPSMKFVQEGYQRGPVHVGQMEMNFRRYVWTKKQMDTYRKMKEKEGLELLRTVSNSVKAAMEALGVELFGYLEEAGEAAKKKTKEKPKKGLTERFLGDFITIKKDKPVKVKKFVPKGNYGEANGFALFHLYNGYKTFKKAHRMTHW